MQDARSMNKSGLCYLHQFKKSGYDPWNANNANGYHYHSVAIRTNSESSLPLSWESAEIPPVKLLATIPFSASTSATRSEVLPIIQTSNVFPLSPSLNVLS